MSQYARVESIEALTSFRASLWKFAQTAQASATAAVHEVQRTLLWLEQEAGPRWQKEVRAQQQRVLEAKQALNRKRLYAGPDGSRRSAVEEEQALSAAQRRLQEAERKLANVKRWRRELDREFTNFRGAVQGAIRAAEMGVPNASAHLDRLIRALEGYLTLAPPTQASGGLDDAPAGSVARPESSTADDAPAQEQAEDPASEAGEEERS